MLAASSCHRIIPKHVNGGGVAVNRKRSRQRVYIMFLAPALIVYTVFMVYPLLSSLGYSFINGTAISGKGLQASTISKGPL